MAFLNEISDKIFGLILKWRGFPRHVGFVVDGNRTYAREHGYPKGAAHYPLGAKKIVGCIENCKKLGIPEITMFIFSTKNWERSKEEVDLFLEAVHNLLLYCFHESQDVAYNIIGNSNHKLSEKTKYLITKLFEKSKQMIGRKDCMKVNFAIGYTCKEDLIEASWRCIQHSRKNSITREFIWDQISDVCGTEVDLIVRTSLARRLSHFLSWEAAHAHLLFLAKKWPEFEKFDLYAALMYHQNRTSRGRKWVANEFSDFVKTTTNQK